MANVTTIIVIFVLIESYLYSEAKLVKVTQSCLTL